MGSSSAPTIPTSLSARELWRGSARSRSGAGSGQAAEESAYASTVGVNSNAPWPRRTAHVTLSNGEFSLCGALGARRSCPATSCSTLAPAQRRVYTVHRRADHCALAAK